MKVKLIFCQLLLAIVLATTSCRKTSDTVAPTTASEKGALLFWAGDVGLVSACGPLKITLNNGQSATITRGLLTAPANCVNTVGGYFYVDEGTYSYTLTAGCNTTFTGTIKVVDKTCNIKQVL